MRESVPSTSYTLVSAAQQYVTQEKKEGKLRKLLKEAKATIDALKKELTAVKAELKAVKFDFDGTVLTEALQKTFNNRSRHYTVEQFEQIMTFDADDGMQKKWKSFVRKIDTKTDDFSTVLKVIIEFLAAPYTASVTNSKYNEQWSAANNKWCGL